MPVALSLGRPKRSNGLGASSTHSTKSLRGQGSWKGLLWFLITELGFTDTPIVHISFKAWDPLSLLSFALMTDPLAAFNHKVCGFRSWEAKYGLE